MSCSKGTHTHEKDYKYPLARNTTEFAHRCIVSSSSYYFWHFHRTVIIVDFIELWNYKSSNLMLIVFIFYYSYLGCMAHKEQYTMCILSLLCSILRSLFFMQDNYSLYHTHLYIKWKEKSSRIHIHRKENINLWNLTNAL